MGADAGYRIVVAIDGTQLSEAVIDQALDLGRGRPKVELHVVRIVTDEELAATSGRGMLERREHVLEHLPAETGARLDQAKRRMVDPPDALRSVVHVRFGWPVETIEQVAAEVDADVVVVGMDVAGPLEPLPHHSVAADVLKFARCPVLVVRPKSPVSAAAKAAGAPRRTTPLTAI